jgi:hypothetical protein
VSISTNTYNLQEIKNRHTLFLQTEFEPTPSDYKNDKFMEKFFKFQTGLRFVKLNIYVYGLVLFSK